MDIGMEAKETVVKELKRSTRYFLNYMKEYSSREDETTQHAGCWNIRQVIEHVILADRAVYELLQKPFKQKKNGHYSKYHVRDLLLNRHRKIKNRTPLNPTTTSEKKFPELLEEFKLLRQEIIAKVESDDIDVYAEDALPHDALGLLTRRDWLYMMCFHSDRHIAQTQELLFVN